MDVNDYFDPVIIEPAYFKTQLETSSYLNSLTINHVDHPIKTIKEADIAIIGVAEDRNSLLRGCAEAPNEIRKQLYKLYKNSSRFNVYDLGNIKATSTASETHFALREVLIELLNKGILPIILGGNQDLTYPAFLAYHYLQKQTSITLIDSRFDLKNATEKLDETTFISKIILHQSEYLYNIANIGFQTYLVPNEELTLMSNLLFDLYRLGEVRSDIREIEPIIRDSDMLSMDISAVKQADAPGCNHTSPNGLTADEICQLAKYAGLSDKVSSFGIYEVNPQLDDRHQTSKLAAQVIWHFIDGYYARKNDSPNTGSSAHTKFIVDLNQIGHRLIFYKSIVSERWWMEIPQVSSKYLPQLLACTYTDYQCACNQEIPDRLWRFMQKTS